MTETQYLVVWASLYKSKNLALTCPIVESRLFTGSTASDETKDLLDGLQIDPTVLHSNIVIYQITGENLSVRRLLYPMDATEYMIKSVDATRETCIIQRIEVRKYGRGLPEDVNASAEIKCKVLEWVKPEEIGECLATNPGAIPPVGWAMGPDATIYKLFVDNSVEIDPNYPQTNVTKATSKQKTLLEKWK